MSKKRTEAVNSLRALSSEDLDNKLKNIKEDLFWLKYKNRSGQSVNANDIRKAKIEVAQINTVLREKV